MSTLYLDRRETSLKREGRAVVVYQGGNRHASVPMGLLDRVVMRGSVALDTGLLGALAEAGIAVTLLSGRQGRGQAMLLGRGHGDARRRIAQYRAYDDAQWRARWSRRLVHHKLVSQLRLLRHALTRRPDLRLALTRGTDALGRILLDVRDPRADLDRLRGLEGAAAAAYFAAFTQMFAPTLEFTGRNRRPPRDPVNACLSLGYTLLHHEAVQASHGAGLDPLIGFFHELAYGRESLASDLIEPLRARLDEWVWGLFRERVLRAEHFSTDAGACLLDKGGRAAFYREYETFAPPLRRLLRRVLARVVKALLGDLESPPGAA